MSKEKFRLLSLYLLDIIIVALSIVNVLYENISLDILIRFVSTYCVTEFFIEWFIFDILLQYKKEKKND